MDKPAAVREIPAKVAIAPAALRWVADEKAKPPLGTMAAGACQPATATARLHTIGLLGRWHITPRPGVLLPKRVHRKADYDDNH